MFDFFKTKANQLMSDVKFVFNLCIRYPQVPTLFVLNYIFLPTMAREISKVYWLLDCGTFQQYKVDPIQAPKTPTSFIANGKYCFFPFRDINPDADSVMCYMGDKSVFENIEEKSGALKLDIRGGMSSVCEEFMSKIEL